MIPTSPPDSTNGSVLIVDDSQDSREVLRTLLERRGLRIFDSGKAEEGLILAQRHRPRVIVFDRDVEPSVEGAFLECTMETGSTLIILASARRPHVGQEPCSVVAKPYHYGPLLRKIEALTGRCGDEATLSIDDVDPEQDMTPAA